MSKSSRSLTNLLSTIQKTFEQERDKGTRTEKVRKEALQARRESSPSKPIQLKQASQLKEEARNKTRSECCSLSVVDTDFFFDSIYSHNIGVDVDLRLVGGLAVLVDGHALVLAGVLLHAALVDFEGRLLAHVRDGGGLAGLQLLAVPGVEHGGER